MLSNIKIENNLCVNMQNKREFSCNMQNNTNIDNNLCVIMQK